MTGNFGPRNIKEAEEAEEAVGDHNQQGNVAVNNLVPSDDEDDVPVLQLVNKGKNVAPPLLKKCKGNGESEDTNDSVNSAKFQFKVPKQKDVTVHDSVTKKSSVQAQFKAPAPAVGGASTSKEKKTHPKSKAESLPKIASTTSDEKFDKIFQLFHSVAHSEVDEEILLSSCRRCLVEKPENFSSRI